MGKGMLKACFENAANATMWSDDLTYVEGFAHSGWGMLVHHAWAVNAEGKAIELTWRDGTDECGFCVDGERKLDEDDEGFDEDDEETWHASASGARAPARSTARTARWRTPSTSVSRSTPRPCGRSSWSARSGAS